MSTVFLIHTEIPARLTDHGSILSMSGPDLERTTQLSASDVGKLQQAVALAVPRLPMVTGSLHTLVT